MADQRNGGIVWRTDTVTDLDLSRLLTFYVAHEGTLESGRGGPPWGSMLRLQSARLVTLVARHNGELNPDDPSDWSARITPDGLAVAVAMLSAGRVSLPAR